MASAWTCPTCSTHHPATGWDDPPNDCRVCEDWPRCESCDERAAPDDIEDGWCLTCRDDVERLNGERAGLRRRLLAAEAERDRLRRILADLQAVAAAPPVAAAGPDEVTTAMRSVP